MEIKENNYQLATSFNEGIETTALFAGWIAWQHIVPIDFPCHRMDLGLEFVMAIAKKRYDGHHNYGYAQEER